MYSHYIAISLPMFEPSLNNLFPYFTLAFSQLGSTIHFFGEFLLGGWATPLKNISSSVGMMKCPTGKNTKKSSPKHRFQISIVPLLGQSRPSSPRTPRSPDHRVSEAPLATSVPWIPMATPMFACDQIRSTEGNRRSGDLPFAWETPSHVNPDE